MEISKGYITDLKSYLPDYLLTYHSINSRNFFRCLNPEHEDKNPSMHYSDKYKICKCFSCNVRYDIFDLIRLDYGIDNFHDQVVKVAELFGKKKPQFNYPEKDYVIVDYNSYYIFCFNHRFESDYLQTRGIDMDLQEEYNIGYDPKNDKIVFPINDNCFFARGTKDDSKIKSKGKSYLWNEKILDDADSNDLIYVTEGIIDSLSLLSIDKNIKTISLNSLSNIKRLFELCEEKNLKCNFVLAFDNDSAGLSYQKKAEEEFIELGINSFPITLISNFKRSKDLNEALLEDKELLKRNLDFFDTQLKIFIEKTNQKDEGDYEL